MCIYLFILTFICNIYYSSRWRFTKSLKIYTEMDVDYYLVALSHISAIHLTENRHADKLIVIFVVIIIIISSSSSSCNSQCWTNL
jgi:hypothetical protein